MTKIINSLSEISEEYDIFILDQWGVMHNGLEGYNHAINAVDKLIKANKKLIIISNSSRRKKNSIERLYDFGFDKNHFIEVMTSGEMVWQELFNSIDKYGIQMKKCFHIYDVSKEDGIDFRNGLEKFEFVDNIKQSDFILACTPFVNSSPLDYIPMLNDALDKNLIMFCANPDFVTVEPNNEKNIFCMGTIADLYKNMGGKVVIIGNPSKEIYLESCRQFNELDLSRIIAIGDSLDHDILGAQNFGIDSILISSGIHKDFFEDNHITGLKKIEISKKWNIKPTYICSNFSF